MSLKPNDRIDKRAGESEPRGFDWTYWLDSFAPTTTETVSTSTWAVRGPDAALATSSPGIVTGAKKTQVVLSGGSVDAVYELENTVTTTPSGYIGVRKVYIRVIQN
jgi:hypothetical protein